MMLTGPRRKASDAQGGLVPTRYTIGLSAAAPSVLLLAEKAAIHA